MNVEGRFLSAAAALVLALLITRQGVADEKSDRWGGKGTIELHFEPVAIANPTPHGLFGLSASYAPESWLALSAGLGFNFVGYEARPSPQLSFMPRLRSVNDRSALGFGLGASVGD